MLNFFCNREYVQLISKSIPRSGHHYLVSLLQDIYGDELYYCEFYQPSTEECCKKVPCKKIKECNSKGQLYKITLQKSHDFELQDKVLKTSKKLKYIISYRDFKDWIKSHTKLFLLDEFSRLLLSRSIHVKEIYATGADNKELFRKALNIISDEEFHDTLYLKYIENQFIYHKIFMEKWAPIIKNRYFETYIIHYDDLTNHTEYELEKLIQFIGIEPKQSIKKAIIKKPVISNQEKKLDYCELAESLYKKYRKKIEAYSKEIKRIENF